MRRLVRSLAPLWFLVLLAAGCAPAPTPPIARPPEPVAAATDALPAAPPALNHVGELEQYLSDAGVALTYESEQDLGFLDVPARIYRLAGEDSLEVHTYADAATAEAVSGRVSSNGRVIRDAAGEPVTVQWLGTPHFFRGGPLIVVYVGTNPDTLDALTRALGPPFAGG